VIFVREKRDEGSFTGGIRKKKIPTDSGRESGRSLSKAKGKWVVLLAGEGRAAEKQTKRKNTHVTPLPDVGKEEE